MTQVITTSRSLPRRSLLSFQMEMRTGHEAQLKPLDGIQLRILGSYVKIELLKPGKPNQLIVSATLNDGSHPWLIPPTQAPGTDYKVKITSTINALKQ